PAGPAPCRGRGGVRVGGRRPRGPEAAAAAGGAELHAADIERALPASAAATPMPAAPDGVETGSALRRQGDALVRQTWERCGRSVSRTARELGISRSTVYRHLDG
ncbi:MAG: helix-turn-helix domain-containing protein, partial [Betaproteobacteria bacterium]